MVNGGILAAHADLRKILGHSSAAQLVQGACNAAQYTLVSSAVHADSASPSASATFLDAAQVDATHLQALPDLPTLVANEVRVA